MHAQLCLVENHPKIGDTPLFWSKSLLVLLLLGGELAVRLLLFYSSERDEFLVRLRVGVRVRVIGSGAVVNGKGV